MKNIFLLGASGSIGNQTIDIIRNNKDQFRLIAFSVGKNIDYAVEVINEFNPKAVCVQLEKDANILKEKFDIEVFYGDKGLVQIAKYEPHLKGILVNAVFGSVSLIPTVEAIKIKRDIGIANKEILVAAGEIITKLAKDYNISLIPIDSEHSALWQLVNNEKKSNIDKLIITASGGSFRDLERSQLKNVTLEDALKHPTWNMGAKITINSATMLNKGLEVIEAHWLFNVAYDNILTVLHKDSIIHSMVALNDGVILAHMGVPDMRIPIQYALTYPDRFEVKGTKIFNLWEKDISFNEMDYERYPMLKLAFEVGKKGGLLPAVYNAANEAALDLFLDRKISFLDIEKIVIEAINNTSNMLNPSLEDIISIDKVIKQQVKDKYTR